MHTISYITFWRKNPPSCTSLKAPCLVHNKLGFCIIISRSILCKKEVYVASFHSFNYANYKNRYLSLATVTATVPLACQKSFLMTGN